ncbi:MAG: TrbC/VirB2 family protein, partial [Pseudomonadota bacterium]|nr:TrbC/VirB2 family protein [Pseudomonadota bacterium]
MWPERQDQIQGKFKEKPGKGRVAAVIGLVTWSLNAWASLPWESPICTFANSMAGPVAHGVAMIAIVVTGLLMSFGEHGG